MNDDIHALVGAYAVDAVDDDERARFEAHLSTCGQCRAEVDSLRGTAAHVAALADTPPPASLKAALMRDIGSVRPLPPVVAEQQQEPSGPPAAAQTAQPAAGPDELRARRESRAHARNPVVRWVAGAAAAAAIVVGGAVWHPWDSGAPRTTVSASQQVMQARDARTYTDRSTTVVRSASLGKAVVKATLPPPPAGHVYELWLQRPDGKMARAGVVSDVAGVRNGVVLDGDAATATGVGITVEPEGGSDAPTTPPVALVSFS
jgi:predicted anti-sigma-YlaC factor YlaD